MANHFHLYLIRHGQSANNAVAESQRVEDPGLTAIGERQAELLAERFREQRFSHLLTSGFLRAVQTMQPLARRVRVRPAIWTDLHEVGGCYRGHEPGNLEGRPGMNRETLATRFPDFQLPDDIDELGWWKSRPFESHLQARKRAAGQAERLLREFRGTGATVACVIHADFKALLLDAFLPDERNRVFSADLVNTGVTLLRCSLEGNQVLEFNDAEHLHEELITS